MPIIKIKNTTKSQEVSLKCEKINEKVAYKMNLADLPGGMTLIVDIGERKSSFAMEGFFVNEGNETAYQIKNRIKGTLIGWEGADEILMYNMSEDSGETDGIPGVITNFTTAYIEGENYFKFTAEFVEKLTKKQS